MQLTPAFIDRAVRNSVDYGAFLTRRAQEGSSSGFKTTFMPDKAFDFQSFLIDWNCWKGKSATLADCGLGKTVIELGWAENVVRHTNRPVLYLTPIAVGAQTIEESVKFGVDAIRSRDGRITGKRVYVTNYEKLHHFSPDDFCGVVCDEASCIKAFDGKRRAQVTEFLRTIPYRLLATATAAPNDYIELGTLSEALGVLGQVDMLNRFFKNAKSTSDMRGHYRGFHAPRSYESPTWRFKGHAEIPFWRWTCGWSRSGRKPSDFGPYEDSRFILPPLIQREHIVETRQLRDGMLFATPAGNRSEELEERRVTIQERCEKVAELANTGEQYIVWCQLNPEGDLLEKLCPKCVQISGSDSDEEKEEKFAAWFRKDVDGLISKHKIAGWGVNAQQCHHVLEFADHSYEAHYQGIRRAWRFGQQFPVINDIISTEGQRGAKENMQRKARNADQMFTSLVAHMHEAMSIEGYKFDQEVEVPAWL